MVCIYCGSKTQVTNSRHQKRDNKVWRRRHCAVCGNTFTSLEGADLSGSIMVRKVSALEPFWRDKLLISVYDSLRHRKTAINDAEGLTGTIISRLYPHLKDAQIKQEDIIKTASLVLQRFDKVAATHYKAFHPLNLKVEDGSWKIGVQSED